MDSLNSRRKSMKVLTKITSVAAVSAMVLLGAGCDRKEDTTAGEKLDNAVANTQQEAKTAANAVENKTENVGQTIDDAAITTALKGKYVLDDELKAHDINVDTVNGVVTLTGAAPSQGAIDRATTIAKSVDGVKDVQNQLTVKAVN